MAKPETPVQKGDGLMEIELVVLILLIFVILWVVFFPDWKIACWHSWEEISRHEKTFTNYDLKLGSSGKSSFTKMIVVSKCSKCGMQQTVLEDL